jgi:hypothetical protein
MILRPSTLNSLLANPESRGEIVFKGDRFVTPEFGGIKFLL